MILMIFDNYIYDNDIYMAMIINEYEHGIHNWNINAQLVSKTRFVDDIECTSESN